MSAVKTLEQIEFADLFARLKKHDAQIKAKDIAVLTKMSPQQVSQILSGKRSTSQARLQLLRDHVRKICDGESSPSEARDLEYWKQKAGETARELHELRQSLRKITGDASFASSIDTTAKEPDKLRKSAEVAVARHFLRRKAARSTS